MNENDCQNVFALLSEYIDRDLAPGTCEELDRHIQGCAPCVEFVESLRKSIALCRGYSPPELPKPLSEDARHQLQEAYRKMLAENRD